MTQLVSQSNKTKQFLQQDRKNTVGIVSDGRSIPILRKGFNSLFSVFKSSYMYSSTLWFLLILLINLSLGAQPNEVLDSYIQKGLENNLALKQKKLNLELSLQALNEANGLFYPQVGVESQYFSAKGGRAIELPVGDMLNPVYSSLNQILQGMGQDGGFPQIENQEIRFLPNDYHDTKLRIIIPLVNSEIYYNRKIKKEIINYTEAEVLVYKRELVKEIKTAYFRYLQSIKVVEAYSSALGLVNEAYRVNEKLVNNQMAGKEKLLRIDAERSQVEAQYSKAENEMKTATVYFNFLLNEPLQTSILVDSLILEAKSEPINRIQPFELKNREELFQMNSALKQSEYYLKLKKSYLMPVITNITDLGYQGYYLAFNREQEYMMNTVSLSWTLFNGFQNRTRIKQAQLQNATILDKISETEQQIELQNQVSANSLESAEMAEKANLNSLNSSKEYYKVVSRQYTEGQKSLLELLDARNQLTSAQINFEVSHFEVFVRLADYERVTAAYPVE